MSLYNLLHGVNPNSALLLAIINVDQEGGPWHSGRFRDIYPNDDGTQVILYTRNGGGNREHWNDDKEPGEDCNCTGCTITYHLPKHPLYLEDNDDDFDSTYAYIHFSVPKEYADIVKGMATGEPPKTIHEKFTATMNEMQQMDKEQVMADPRFKPIAEFLERVAGTSPQ